jgi:thiol-disulfide isomerase/thioredoxin
MKKTFTFLLASCLAISSSAQIKKVVLEDFTGTWCGWCPEGTVVLEQLKATHGDNFFPVASHNGDALEVPDGAAIDAGLNVTGYPNGAVDRVKFAANAKIPMSRGGWSNYTNQRLGEQALASVSLGNTYKVGADSFYADINVQFTTAPAAGVPLKVNVYVLEDSIAAIGTLQQDNYSPDVQGGAAVLTNWYHNHTLRDALLGVWGDATVVPTNPVIGTTYTKKVGMKIPAAWNRNQIHLLAFVCYGGTAANFQVDIINAEEKKLNYFYPTSINGLESINSNTVITPNPANASQDISVQYDVLEDATISMNILNTLGQVIAAPYTNIYDIKGTHTLKVNTQKLSAGMYFVALHTKTGSQLTKFVIQ